MDGFAHLIGCVAGQRNGVDSKESWVFVSGKSAEPFGFGGYALVANEAAIEPCRSAVGEDVGDGVVGGVIGVAIVGLVVSLDIEGLRGFADDDGLFGDLGWFDGGHRLG